MNFADFSPAERADFDACLRCRTFLAQILALGRGQRGEKIVEALIAPVLPMELDVAADQPAGRLKQGDLVGLDESRMSG